MEGALKCGDSSTRRSPHSESASTPGNFDGSGVGVLSPSLMHEGPARNDAPFHDSPDLSVIVPVYNEADNLPFLHERLTRTLVSCGRSYEICYVDDGSTDGSLRWLLRCASHDHHVRVVELKANVGQHAAVMAGFAVARGEVVVTLDADLQNPPEEIPRLLGTLDRGFDVVAGRRGTRNDPWSRVVASVGANQLVRLMTGTSLTDHGCMLRAYRRGVVDAVLGRNDLRAFVPVLANAVARRTTEVPVAHAPRWRGESKYSALGLVRLLCALFVSTLPLAVRRLRWCGAVAMLSGVAVAGVIALRPVAAAGDVSGWVKWCGSALIYGGLLLVSLSFLLSLGSRVRTQGKRKPADLIRAVHQWALE
ncbi:Undecaprenyl-phosphate 4-deoxy-4-formamido-L-arabinose transferase [bacterium HR30]|nr:Undecaprenyl-phosphate 4-deoxy-4-formamido-L-arabinose transferase [bacterium HR30]